MECNCYVRTLSDYERFITRWGAHSKSCPKYRESRDPVDRRQDEYQRRMCEPKCNHEYGAHCTIERCLDTQANSWRRHCVVCKAGFANQFSRGNNRAQHEKTVNCTS